ncbi:hypothetical protein GX411_04760 [Candidatus Fermentibacteria bacterium]|nr:hypothetical protein [Candidatus Fermentibacteria bacterium]
MFRLIALVLSVGLVMLGLVFLVASGAGNTASRLVVGAVMIAAGAFLLVFVRRSAMHGGSAAPSQKIDLSGDVHLEEMKCARCGGSLSAQNVSVRAGAVFISCPYCRSEYQIEEKPRW